MKFSLPEITADDRANQRFFSYTDDAIQGTKLIEALSFKNLKRLMSGRNNIVRRAVMDAMGHDTNPSWITARAAEKAYTDGMLSEEDFDRISRE